MKSIEQIALETWKQVTPKNWFDQDCTVEFATKFLEAWLAQQEPVAWLVGSVIDSFAVKGYETCSEADAKLCDGFPVFLAPPTATPEGWISVEDKLPHTGDLCLICINGVRQNEVYTFDCADSGEYSSPYFWSRDDLDECPTMSPRDLWQPLPPPPGEKK